MCTADLSTSSHRTPALLTDGGVDEKTDEGPVVLVVDDEERIPQAFALWLDDDYEVRTANSGEEAFERLDDDVDVVLLDRQMPGISGDDVLDRIREGEYGCRVAMVTGVDPDFDIVDMPFDDYLTKPVGREELRETVDRLLSISDYDEEVRSYFALTEKRATLEAEKTRTELEDHEGYEGLLDALERREEQMDELMGRMDSDQLDTLFRDLTDDAEAGTPGSADR
ncbi:hoxA-like transcriptional regulator [Halarchaeum acidiphilum MH1-52-1]|uniref:HoxA-like transcriptional regulator n=1 Tax=Halarchaeum acidiphilum MH1-52-1 TaxID=1261545 RepID=U2YS06_9EURY|nr:response regulator [Halarchaeum acidiphilum]GAD51522.1 hoxA-like transcriptional regulator [Halarchaeum acidiphilum MH1-52-1]